MNVVVDLAAKLESVLAPQVRYVIHEIEDAVGPDDFGPRRPQLAIEIDRDATEGATFLVRIPLSTHAESSQ